MRLISDSILYCKRKPGISQLKITWTNCNTAIDIQVFIAGLARILRTKPMLNWHSYDETNCWSKGSFAFIFGNAINFTVAKSWALYEFPIGNTRSFMRNSLPSKEETLSKAII